MTHAHSTRHEHWTVKQAVVLAALCLATGIAGGWAIRAAQSPSATGPAQVAAASPQAAISSSPVSSAPSPAQLKQMADAQAAPLLEKLKADPENPDALVNIGNLYYDAQQYSDAVTYYAHALRIRPSDAAVRTDMATAYWYMGNADTAIAEFDKALAYAPTNPNTLFNRGLVRWKGKHDAAGAIADWQKLLATDPNYAQKGQVEQLMNEARQASAK
jgi:tetratricopeptide (TPR) repeat protein